MVLPVGSLGDLPMRQLAGKTAMVTGAARGIGRAIALQLAARHMRVVLVDRDQVGLEQTRRAAGQLGVDSLSYRCDLTDASQIQELVDWSLQHWAGVDLLVNNAGVAHYGPTHEHKPAAAENLLAVNLHAPVRLTYGLLPAMLARPEAHVLNVCSVLGLTPMPRVALYCASKHGLVGFSESLRAEYGRQGLGVTTLCPGFVRTELVSKAVAPASDKSVRQPPAIFCVTAERVARAAVRGVQRNRKRVVVDPMGRWVRAAISAAPQFFDWMYALGRSRRVEKKRRVLSDLHHNEQDALKIQLGIPESSSSSTHRRAA